MALLSFRTSSGSGTGVALNHGYFRVGVGFLGGGTSQLINTGTIEGRTDAVVEGNGGALIVTNSGTLKGAHAFHDYGSSVDQVTNTGSMIGTVELGGGADSYIGASGHL